MGNFDTMSKELVSSMMRQTIYQMFANKITNRNCAMVGDQQTIHPTHVVKVNGTLAAHGVPPTGHVTNSDG